MKIEHAGGSQIITEETLIMETIFNAINWKMFGLYPLLFYAIQIPVKHLMDNIHVNFLFSNKADFHLAAFLMCAGMALAFG
jgi:hypothetical protein